MTNRYLSREDAPIGPDLWGVLDATMLDVARRELAGRRLLYLDGPYGLGLKAVPLADKEVTPGILTSETQPIALIRQSFTLGKRNLAAYERENVALDLTPLVEATLGVARLEDDLIFNGAAGVPGLLTAPGVQHSGLADWAEVGTAAGDVIRAVSALDAAGFHGPYALALAPERYNLLFRMYPQGNGTEIAHARAIATDGVVKAPGLLTGGVLIASGRQYATIVLGQDLSLGFVGPTVDSLEFTVSESLTVRVRVPGAVCVLE
jgi:uncharacterized linocin/CFP29 family protein